MTSSNPIPERKPTARLNIARRVYQALVAQYADRAITLRDDKGKLLAHQDPRIEHAPGIAPDLPS